MLHHTFAGLPGGIHTAVAIVHVPCADQSPMCVTSTPTGSTPARTTTSSPLCAVACCLLRAVCCRQTAASRVSKPISDAIAARGGARAVAAGSTFTAVLTAAGRVLVFGKLYTNSNSRGSTGADSSPPAQAGCVEVALPAAAHVKHIAAGQQHLLMSDGEKVWAVGRWMDEAGGEAGCAPAEAPQQLLALPGSGVVQLAAGMHSSACVDGDGQLWLWGRLLDEPQAQGAVQAGLVLPVGRGSSAGLMQLAEAARRLRQVDWEWAGFGGAAPRRVQGLHGVQRIALGGWHALVMAE